MQIIEITRKERAGITTFGELQNKFFPKKKNTNHKANGVHKYLKQYLKMYNWKDREEVINHYTNNWAVVNDKPLIMNMKQRYNIIQENFDDFVSFLKKLTRKKKTI